jgi:hypothetical protein
MSDLLLRRWRHVLVLLLVVLVPAGVLWALHERQCRKKQEAYRHRLEDLRKQTESLPLGSSKQAVEEFFNINQLPFQPMTDEGKNALVGQVIVESCGPWYCDDEAVIRVTVRFSNDGRVLARDVRTWRTCL